MAIDLQPLWDGLKPLVKEELKTLIDQVAFPELEKLVKESQNKIDDAILAVGEEPLKALLKQLVDKI